MQRRILLAGVALVLLLGGCLTRNESSQHPDIVGKTLVLARPCYVYNGSLITSVWWNTAREIWWLEEKDSIDQILATTEAAEVREAYKTPKLVPVGTKFTIQKIQVNVDFGLGGFTYALGILLIDGNSVPCAVTIAGPTGPYRTPWDLPAEPE